MPAFVPNRRRANCEPAKADSDAVHDFEAGGRRFVVFPIAKGKLGQLLILVSAAGLMSLHASEPIPSEIIVELPRFEVVDSRLLPQPEQWRYAEIPGFEILANTSDSDSKRFLRDFARGEPSLPTLP